MKRVKIRPNRGSHLPILVRTLKVTCGPVLELGAGAFSTPTLHAICDAEGRELVTYEHDFQFFEWAEWYRSKLHEVRKVEKWEDVDLSPVWSVAFVDHSPGERRYIDVVRLAHADFVVAHDSEDSSDRRYHYSKAFNSFKYRRRYEVVHPSTTVFSNKHPLENLW